MWISHFKKLPFFLVFNYTKTQEIFLPLFSFKLNFLLILTFFQCITQKNSTLPKTGWKENKDFLKVIYIWHSKVIVQNFFIF